MKTIQDYLNQIKKWDGLIVINNSIAEIDKYDEVIRSDKWIALDIDSKIELIELVLELANIKLLKIDKILIDGQLLHSFFYSSWVSALDYLYEVKSEDYRDKLEHHITTEIEKTEDINAIIEKLLTAKLTARKDENLNNKSLKKHLKFIDEQVSTLKELSSINSDEHNIEKIKWKSTPSVFGFLMSEFVKKGFIEPPLYNGEPNFSGLARLCFRYFEFENVEGGSSEGTLRNELNENKNSLSDTKRQKFNIPEANDLK